MKCIIEIKVYENKIYQWCIINFKILIKNKLNQ